MSKEHFLSGSGKSDFEMFEIQNQPIKKTDSEQLTNLKTGS